MTAREKNLSFPTSLCLRQVSDQGFLLGRRHKAEQRQRQGLRMEKPDPNLGRAVSDSTTHLPRLPDGPSSLLPALGSFVGSLDLTSNNPQVS